MSTVTLKWTDATTRTDGTPGTPASVDIFQAPDAVTPIGTVNGGVGTFTTKDLPAGNYSFMVVQTDSNGVKSAPSNTATATVTAGSGGSSAPLNAISDLSASVDSPAPSLKA